MVFLILANCQSFAINQTLWPTFHGATRYSSFVGERTLHINYRQKTLIDSHVPREYFPNEHGRQDDASCQSVWGSKTQYETIEVSLFALTNARDICDPQFQPF